MTASRTNRSSRIFLTGFMGSGKSTVGPVLASTLGYRFIDLDATVEQAAGKPVRSIFRDDGERAFRDLERRELRKLSLMDSLVVALGGGALTDPGSRAIVRARGILVYIEVPLEEIVARLRCTTDRPLITADDGSPLDEEALRMRVRALIDAREPLYRQADITVNTAGSTLGQTVDSLARKIARHLSR